VRRGRGFGVGERVDGGGESSALEQDHHDGFVVVAKDHVVPLG